MGGVDRQRSQIASEVTRLREGFGSGRTRTIAWRRRQLKRLLALLHENHRLLAEALATDLGRPRQEAWGADIGNVASEIRYLLRNLEKWSRPRRVKLPMTAQPGKGWIQAEPLGVVLVIAPWNYPIQLVVEPVAAALAAGNVAMVKQSPQSSATTALLGRLLTRYLDTEAVSVAPAATDPDVLLDQHFDHIFFTGSSTVGRQVMAAAARNLSGTTLELGGKCPAIVHRSAVLETAARRIAWGAWFNVGQTCTGVDYVIADASVRDRLVVLLQEEARRFYGPYPQRSADYGRIISPEHTRRLAGVLKNSSGTVAFGGDVDLDDRYVAPTVVVDPDPDSELMRDEIFGPIVPVITTDTLERALEIVREHPKPLAAYFFGTDEAAIETFLTTTTSGGTCINHALVQAVPSALPFGGVGPSGAGHYHGKAGFDELSNLRTVLTYPARKDAANTILYPPYTKAKGRALKALFRA